MCGIYSIFNNPFDKTDSVESKKEIIYNNSFKCGECRGPDDSEFEMIDLNENSSILVGFHRLAINGLDSISNQPIKRDNCVLICNGEIYNFKELSKKYNIQLETHSDCEIIIPLYRMFGFDKMIQMLDGVFAFMLIDTVFDDENIPLLYIARDPFGVRPLYEYYTKNKGYSINKCYAISSTLKPLINLHNIALNNRTSESNEYKVNDYTLFKSFSKIKQFKPGTYKMYKLMSFRNNPKMYSFIFKKNVKWHVIESLKSFPNLSNENMVFNMIRNSLYDAVLKRVHNTDREIACLLSGGLDSSLITSIVHKFYQTPERLLKTFSIGLEGSVDLKYAKIVADYLGTDHTEIVVTENDFLDAIPEVIKNIESYDTTTVRASTGNYLVSKYIKENSDCKVIFNGDGADELMGGYMYMHCAPNANEFDLECRRLLNDIYYFDVLRSDRSISSNGLEARTPFLDKTFVSTYLSIPEKMRFHSQNKQCEKWLIRKAFDSEELLPKEVLWRTKEAFSDGVSSQKKSWFQIIQDYVNIELKKQVSNKEIEIIKHSHFNTPMTSEQIWYRYLFNKEFNFKNIDKIIPYFWMPKFVEGATDASARTLDIYKNKMNS